MKYDLNERNNPRKLAEVPTTSKYLSMINSHLWLKTKCDTSQKIPYIDQDYFEIFAKIACKI